MITITADWLVDVDLLSFVMFKVSSFGNTRNAIEMIMETITSQVGG